MNLIMEKKKDTGDQQMIQRLWRNQARFWPFELDSRTKAFRIGNRKALIGPERLDRIATRSEQAVDPWRCNCLRAPFTVTACGVVKSRALSFQSELILRGSELRATPTSD